MKEKKTGVGYKDRPLSPIVEEISLESAERILKQEGFNRVIQISRDPKSGQIVDLLLREATP